MARDFDTYVKAHPETGKEMERNPTTPREVVALEFDGWRKKATKRSSSSSSSSSTSSSSTSSSSSSSSKSTNS